MTRNTAVLGPMFICLLALEPARAQPPEIEAGGCLYLVGAPSGAPAAETEETFTESRIFDGCVHPARVDHNRDAPNMVQAWIEEDVLVDTGASICELQGAVGHVFRTSADLPEGTRAWISLAASLSGRIRTQHVGQTDGSRLALSIRVEEVSPTAPLRLSDTELWTFELNRESDSSRAEAGGARVPIHVRGGREYRVALLLHARGSGGFEFVDAGRPGTAYGAAYESIEVCIEQPGHGANDSDDIERDLYERRCYPRLWLPESKGGRLEEARDLVATRLSQAVASGSPGVNESVAERRLEEADAHSAAGQYQKACRSIVHALHALTTP